MTYSHIINDGVSQETNMEKTYKVCVAYENTFEIEAKDKDEAEKKACKLFWKETQNAELLNLETQDDEE